MNFRTKETVEAGIIHEERAGSSVVAHYEPGDGTRYTLLVVGLSETQGRMTGSHGVVRVASLLNFPGRPSVVVTHGQFVSAGYLEEKMKISRPTALAIAELIAYYVSGSAIAPQELRLAG